MDAMLTEKDKKLAEKEAYIVHLQTALAGDQPITPAPQQKVRHFSNMCCAHHPVTLFNALTLQLFSYREIRMEGITADECYENSTI